MHNTITMYYSIGIITQHIDYVIVVMVANRMWYILLAIITTAALIGVFWFSVIRVRRSNSTGSLRSNSGQSAQLRRSVSHSNSLASFSSSLSKSSSDRSVSSLQYYADKSSSSAGAGRGSIKRLSRIRSSSVNRDIQTTSSDSSQSWTFRRGSDISINWLNNIGDIIPGGSSLGMGSRRSSIRSMNSVSIDGSIDPGTSNLGTGLRRRTNSLNDNGVIFTVGSSLARGMSSSFTRRRRITALSDGDTSSSRDSSSSSRSSSISSSNSQLSDAVIGMSSPTAYDARSSSNSLSSHGHQPSSGSSYGSMIEITDDDLYRRIHKFTDDLEALRDPRAMPTLEQLARIDVIVDELEARRLALLRKSLYRRLHDRGTNARRTYDIRVVVYEARRMERMRRILTRRLYYGVPEVGNVRRGSIKK